MPTIEELQSQIDSLKATLATPASPLPSDPSPAASVGPDGRAVEPRAGEEPVYTWDQLQAAVTENKITEAVAQQMWADQNRRLTVKEATDTVVNRLTAQTTATKVEAEIARYRDMVPAVMDPASEQRQRVVREFRRLVSDLGYDDKDLRTELVALQGAFGPIDALAKMVKKPKSEGHRDVSHDDPGPADDEKDQDKDNSPPSSLSAEERRYYENAIRQRVYKNWGQVRAELKFANQRTRRKYGARA